MARARRKILNVALATETRAEYWLLRPVYDALERRGGVRPTFLASGMHHLGCFGRTIRAIRADRVRRIELPTVREADLADPAGPAAAAARAVDRYGRALADFDWLLVLGDRVEMLAACLAATALGKPIGHVHGGDVAPGARDDAVRHAITKLAHLHFAATVDAARRIRRLGEPGWRVRVAGAPAIDAIRRLVAPPKGELDRAAGFDTDQPFALVVQHAAGFSPLQEQRSVLGTLRAVDERIGRALAIGPGLDAGSQRLHEAIGRFVASGGRAGRWNYTPSLDQPIYYGLLSRAAVLVGNSSSGMIESAAFAVPVVDVGPRQAGRMHSSNVVHCSYGREAVSRAIRTVLEDRAFRRRLARCRNVYGEGRAGEVIAEALARTPIDRRLLVKLIGY